MSTKEKPTTSSQKVEQKVFVMMACNYVSDQRYNVNCVYEVTETVAKEMVSQRCANVIQEKDGEK